MHQVVRRMKQPQNETIFRRKRKAELLTAKELKGQNYTINQTDEPDELLGILKNGRQTLNIFSCAMSYDIIFPLNSRAHAIF